MSLAAIVITGVSWIGYIVHGTRRYRRKIDHIMWENWTPEEEAVEKLWWKAETEYDRKRIMGALDALHDNEIKRRDR